MTPARPTTTGPRTRAERTALLREGLRTRILVLDGAMGTMIQGYGLGEADFRGERFKEHSRALQGANDLLCLTRPDLVAEIHRAYLEAGADLIETNTFNANRISMADYGLEPVVVEINRQAARLARAEADAAEARDPDRPRWVIGALGPTTRSCSISPAVSDPGARSVTFDELAHAYAEQTRGLLEGGADLLMVETVFDTLNAKAALFGISGVLEELGRGRARDGVGHHHGPERSHSVRADSRGVLELRAPRRATGAGTRVRSAERRAQLRPRRGSAAPLPGRDLRRGGACL